MPEQVLTDAIRGQGPRNLYRGSVLGLIFSRVTSELPAREGVAGAYRGLWYILGEQRKGDHS